METTVKFTVSLKDEYGNAYNGEFVVKTLLSRADAMRADVLRRQVIGPSPEGTAPAPALMAEAYMTGQLGVRILQAPDWWNNSNMGQELLDSKIVLQLYELAVAKEQEFKSSLTGKATAASAELKKPKG